MVSALKYSVGTLDLAAIASATDDFRDGYFDRGTLTYAQQLLGDREPDNGFDGWEDSIFDVEE